MKGVKKDHRRGAPHFSSLDSAPTTNTQPGPQLRAYTGHPNSALPDPKVYSQSGRTKRGKECVFVLLLLKLKTV